MFHAKLQLKLPLKYDNNDNRIKNIPVCQREGIYNIPEC